MIKSSFCWENYYLCLKVTIIKSLKVAYLSLNENYLICLHFLNTEMFVNFIYSFGNYSLRFSLNEIYLLTTKSAPLFIHNLPHKLTSVCIVCLVFYTVTFLHCIKLLHINLPLTKRIQI